MADFRAVIRNGLQALFRAGDHSVLHPEAIFVLSDPIGAHRSADSILDNVIAPIRTALTGCQRRDEILIGGKNIRAERGDWVASVTHYVGTFAAPLCGIQPNGRLVFLRAGEFFRVQDGRIVEARIIIDLLDLLRQIGKLPLPDQLGTEMLFPGPATHDGVLPQGGDGTASIGLVEAMLSDLKGFDPTTGESPGQTGVDGYWAEGMFWYGPGGIGSTYRWDGFVKDHRAAFLAAFPDRVGGNHFCRIGDGNYAAITGWPSMTMTHRSEYLGVAATGRDLTLRVMDFYRCANGKIAENWVLLDYVHLFQQMGRDLIAEAK